MPEQTDWVKLVKDAKNSNDGLKILYEALTPVFNFVLTLCDFRYRDDVIQESRIKVWLALKNVDYSRPTEIRAYLSNMILWAMRDWRRKCIRHSLGKPLDSYCYNLSEKQPTTYLFDYDPILQEYLKYIEDNGRMNGAHVFFAKKIKKSKSRAGQLFSDSGRELVNKYKLAGAF